MKNKFLIFAIIALIAGIVFLGPKLLNLALDRFQADWAQADVKLLILACDLFNKDHGRYPATLNELTNSEDGIMTPLDLRIATSRAKISYHQPSRKDSDFVIVEGYTRFYRLEGRMDGRVTRERRKTEQGAAANP
jgi:hypothetical protein